MSVHVVIYDLYYTEEIEAIFSNAQLAEDYIKTKRETNRYKVDHWEVLDKLPMSEPPVMSWKHYPVTIYCINKHDNAVPASQVNAAGKCGVCNEPLI